MLAQVRELLLTSWEKKFPEAFLEGRISSRFTCMAEWYRLITESGTCEVWLEPDWNLAHPGFEKEMGLLLVRNHHLLKNYKPTFVLTENETVVAVGELLFDPSHHSDFHPALSRLQLLDQLAAGTQAQLYLDPVSGHPDTKRLLAFDPELCLFLMVVGKKSGFSMDHAFVTQSFANTSFYHRFVHLTAGTGDSRVEFRGR